MTTISQVIAMINQMEADGIIERYAIGGAVGATFYLEPVSTLDIDIFVMFKRDPGEQLVNLGPIYDYLSARGGRIEGEYIVIAGWPIQFLPPTSPLTEEALAKAITVKIGEIQSRVFTAEHLAAVALQTGRAKDKARLLQFLENGDLDADRFQEILARHGLTAKWRSFKKTFLSGAK